MSALDYCICIEELARVDPGVALSVAAHNGLCAAHILLFGSEAQKTTWLAPLARGEKIGAWGLTESTSGSDAAGMRTAAVRAGECWVLNGSKTFTTHGRVGQVMVVMAITDKAAGTKGISAFIVEHGTPGMRPGKKEDKLGMRASDTSEVLFDNCRVPADALLGDEGQGFVGAMQVLDAGRIGIAALSVGLAQGAYEAALRYSQERRAFGRPISGFQAIQWKLADMATRIEAARLLTYRAAYLKDTGATRTTMASSMAKLYASEIAVRAADDCVQIHGGYGFVKDYPAEKFFRDVKLTTIGEGTSEIQRLVIARQLLAR
jgi:alkylation response protein AidB-like acyl-CoA dehydrogenase